MVNTERDKCVSIHESAHAIIGHSQGRLVEWISIVETLGTWGTTCSTGGDSRIRAINAVSGALADGIYSEGSKNGKRYIGYGDDFDTLESAMAETMPHLKGARARGTLFDDPAVKAIVREAKDIVVRHWPAIESLSRVLEIRKSIAGPELRSLLANLCKPHESSEKTIARCRKGVAELHAKFGKPKPTRAIRSAHGEAEMFLYGEIGPFGISAKEFADELADLGDVPEITLHINSPGGDAFDGVAIFNSLVQHPATIIVRVDGIAASAASLVAMAGDRIEMAENAFLMVHEPMTLTMGNASEHRSVADILENLTDSYVNTYANRRNLSTDEVAKLLAGETWLSASEAVEAGFADEVLAVPAIAASIAKGRFSKTPASLLSDDTYKRPPSTPRRDLAERRMRKLQVA